jgi:hypothetical protein
MPPAVAAGPASHCLIGPETSCGADSDPQTACATRCTRATPLAIRWMVGPRGCGVGSGPANPGPGSRPVAGEQELGAASAAGDSPRASAGDSPRAFAGESWSFAAESRQFAGESRQFGAEWRQFGTEWRPKRGDSRASRGQRVEWRRLEGSNRPPLFHVKQSGPTASTRPAQTRRPEIGRHSRRRSREVRGKSAAIA